MRLRSPVVFLALALIVGAVPAQAAIINFSASLSGLQEVPANASPATGTGAISFDDVTKILSWNITFSGLTAPQTAAHFHIAPPGVNGGVTIGFPLGSPIIGSQALTPAQETALLAGNFYANVHTTAFPGGEIRGQLERAVPVEAKTWGKLKVIYK
ncbi:MAG: CHRD domain-containing protein [Candidatus Eiseniibacteriota bacterium]